MISACSAVSESEMILVKSNYCRMKFYLQLVASLMPEPEVRLPRLIQRQIK